MVKLADKYAGVCLATGRRILKPAMKISMKRRKEIAAAVAAVVLTRQQRDSQPEA
jgi:hypothetical protein